jgi:hypothetical protein
MGVPGLTGRMKGHEVRVKADYIEGWKLFIDGPSLAFFICKSEVIPNDNGSYRQYYVAACETIKRILAFTTDVHVYFDGALPEEKRPMRFQRRQNFISRQKYEPVFAPQLLMEVLGDQFPYIPCAVVADEADTAIAHHVERELKETPIGILSSDSDFYTYQFSSPRVHLMLLSSCDFLSPTPVTYVINLQKVRHLVKTGDLKAVPSLVPDTVLHPTVFLQTQELINSYVVSGYMGAYLQVLNEETQFAPAWEVGRSLRALAYARLLGPYGDFKSMTEFARSGMRYTSKDLPLCDADNADLEQDLSPQKQLVNTLVNEICHSSRGPGKSHENIVQNYFNHIFSTSNPSPLTNKTLSPELIQTFAKIQAMIYSLILLQSSGFSLPITFRITHIDWPSFLLQI